MHELKSPSDRSGFAMEGYDRIGPFVVAAPEPTEVIRAGAASWHEDEIALRIDGHDGPRVCSAGALLNVLLIRLSCRAATGSVLTSRRWRGIGDWIPTPSKSARTHIKGAHDSGWHGSELIVVDGGADNDEIADDGRRRSHVIPAGAITRYVSQANLPRVAEIQTRLAC